MGIVGKACGVAQNQASLKFDTSAALTNPYSPQQQQKMTRELRPKSAHFLSVCSFKRLATGFRAQHQTAVADE